MQKQSLAQYSSQQSSEDEIHILPPKMSGLTVHHLQVGQGERIPWLCEELGIPYELKLYQRSPLLSPPELKAIHPMGASPVIEDATFNKDKPVLLAESGAIAEYLIYRHGDGRLALKPDHPNYADYLYWFHFSNSNMQPVLMRTATARALGSPDDPRRKMGEDRLQIALKNVDDRVANKTWLAGEEFTAADVMLLWSMTTMRKFEPIDLSNFPGILAWLKRCGERPAYKTAMGKSDPDLDQEELRSAKGPSRFAGFAKMQEAK